MEYAFSHQGKAFTPSGVAPAITDTESHNRAVEAEQIALLKTHPERVFCYCRETKENDPDQMLTTWLGMWEETDKPPEGWTDVAE